MFTSLCCASTLTPCAPDKFSDIIKNEISKKIQYTIDVIVAVAALVILILASIGILPPVAMYAAAPILGLELVGLILCGPSTFDSCDNAVAKCCS